MFAVRNYQQGIQRLCAACDVDLLGSLHKEDGFRLEVSADFYDGMRVEEAELERMLGQCTMANLVGDATVALAIKMGLVEPQNVRKIGGVPHAQMMVMLP